MKRFMTILAVLMVCSIQAGGRNTGKEALPFRYEVRLGWSGFPTNDDNNFSGYNDSYFGDTSISDIFGDYDGPTYMTGNFMAEFGFHFRKWFTLSVGVAANGIWKDVYDSQTDLRKGRENGMTMTLMPQARFTWMRKDIYNMYSSIGVGLTGGGFEGRSDMHLAAQCIPFGITIGRRIFGFAEIGFGTIYNGGMIGLGYRF